MRAPAEYLALPKMGQGRGVLVLHSWWGLNEFFRRLCDRFADAGMVALAPDLYDGKVATTVASAKRLRAEVAAARRVPAYRVLTAAIDRLADHKAVRGDSIAVVGCSMGGHWALWLAQRVELPISATVVFYAARDGDFSQSHAKFMFHFAEQDEWVSGASRKKMTRSLKVAGRDTVYFDYPGTKHWFFERDRTDAYSERSANLAWERSLPFLDEPTNQHRHPTVRTSRPVS